MTYQSQVRKDQLKQLKPFAEMELKTRQLKEILPGISPSTNIEDTWLCSRKILIRKIHFGDWRASYYISSKALNFYEKFYKVSDLGERTG